MLGLKIGKSFNAAFDNAGFEGSNFIIGIGILFFYYILFPIYVAIHQISKYVFQDQIESACFNKFLMKQSYKRIMIKFLLESCLEVGLTAIKYCEEESCLLCSIRFLVVLVRNYIWVVVELHEDTELVYS